jgi:hypothetical protein
MLRNGQAPADGGTVAGSNPAPTPHGLGQPAPQHPEPGKDRDEPQGDDGRLCAEVVQVSHVCCAAHSFEQTP